MYLCFQTFTKLSIGAATATMGAHSTQKLIEFRSTKIDEGLPILRAFCGSAIISNDLRSHRKILRRTLGHNTVSDPRDQALPITRIGRTSTSFIVETSFCCCFARQRTVVVFENDSHATFSPDVRKARSRPRTSTSSCKSFQVVPPSVQPQCRHDG